MVQHDKILFELLMTEKATQLSAINQYVFKVSPRADRISVGKAVEKAFADKNIKVKSVNILNVKPKAKRSKNRRGVSTKAGYKKAFVTLRDGDALDLV